MGRRPVLPLGRWAPIVLGVVALALLLVGGITQEREMVVVGAVAAVALLVAFPLAELLLGKDRQEGPDD